MQVDDSGKSYYGVSKLSCPTCLFEQGGCARLSWCIPGIVNG